MGRAGVTGTVFPAVADGIRRVNRAPMILVGVWALTFVVSLPPALVLRAMIARHLGSSLAADSAATGVNYEWMQEFADQASGIGVTFKPTIIGFGAVLDNLSSFADNEPQPAAIVGTAAAYVVLWIFLAGAIIDRYARDRATRAHGFFAAAGVFFFRFARLAVVQIIVYGVLFNVVHPWLFDRLFVSWTKDMTVERNAFLVRAALYLVFGLLLAACSLVFDYAKVRSVVEDRRSMLGAISAAVRFIRGNLPAAAGVYVANVVLFAALLAVYAIGAPAGAGGGAMAWITFTLGQIFIAARLGIKLLFWASETALFQQRFAHADYVARPTPPWPDSPAAEAL